MKYTLENLKINLGEDYSDSSFSGKKNQINRELEIGRLEIEYDEMEFRQLIGFAKDALDIIKDLSKS